MSKPKSTKISGASLKHAFREIIWPRRKLLAMGLFLILANRLAGLVLPASTKYLVDDVIAKGDISLLYKLLAFVAGAVAVQAMTSYALTMLLSVEAQHLIAQLRTQVQRHVLQLPIRVFDSMKSGVLVSRIMEDVEGVRNLVGTGLVQLVGGTVTALVSLVFRDVNIAFWSVVMFTAIQQFDNHVISPNILKSRVQLNPAFILLALLLGGSIGGFFGLLIAVPVAAALRVIVGHVWRTRVLEESWDEAAGAMITEYEPPNRESLVGRLRRAGDVNVSDGSANAAGTEPEGPQETNVSGE